MPREVGPGSRAFIPHPTDPGSRFNPFTNMWESLQFIWRHSGSVADPSVARTWDAFSRLGGRKAPVVTIRTDGTPAYIYPTQLDAPDAPDSALITCWGAYIPPRSEGPGGGSGHSTGEGSPLHGTRGRIAAHALPPFPLWCGIDNTACGIEDDPHQFLTDVDKYQRAAGISDIDMCAVWGRMMGSDGRGKEGGRHKHDSGDTRRWWNSLGEPDSFAQCKEWFVAQYVGTANLVADATHRAVPRLTTRIPVYACPGYLSS